MQHWRVMFEHQKDKNYQHLVAKLLDSTAATVMTGLLRMVQAVLMGLKYRQIQGLMLPCVEIFYKGSTDEVRYRKLCG